MITNEHMRRLLDTATPISGGEGLPGPLQEIAEAAWGRGASGVLSPGGPPPAWTEAEAGAGPEELMRTELEVNDFKIDDEDLVPDPDSYLRRTVSRGLLFASACLRRAADLPEAGRLRAVVITGVDDDFLTHGTTVKFFLHRGGLPSRYQDVERYILEGIAVLGPDDLPSLEPAR
ncbi:hypothetical protein J0910_24605 [Nocardiopsis sp. CNT-189]|uniref:hypothetical protein n=1 Tax=Nocardiopsis oceanisediminis TaxID=2816862 RepID=UPI003B35B0C1